MDREAYLRTVLRLDPIGRARSVVAERNAYRGYPTMPEPDPIAEERIRTWLTTWRHGFWQEGEAAACRERLLAADLSCYPGLADRVAHLEAVWQARPAFLDLMKNPSVDREFLAFLGQVLVAPADQMAGMVTVYKAPDERDIAGVQATIAALEEKAPTLHAMQRDWLIDLVENPSGRRRSREPRLLLVKGVGLLTILFLSVWLLLEVMA